MKSSVRLIVTDLDGTLLRGDKSISDYTADVFRRCRERGIKVAFATARSEKSSERFSSIVRPDAFISNGGALTSAGGELILSLPIPAESANTVFERCAESRGLGYITVDTERGYFVNYEIDPNHPGWLDYSHAIRTDFSAGFDWDVYKLTVEAKSESAVRALVYGLSDVDVIAFSGEDWYRLAHRDATKWNAVAALLSRYGWGAESAVAFGDDYNDLEMLKNCGIGVAMANAAGEVKEAADHICPSNDEDGAARWIEENIL